MASTALVRYWQSSAPSVAASSFNRGTLIVWMGATLLLDMRNVHDTSPLGVVAVRYATAPCASLLCLSKGFPTKLVIAGDSVWSRFLNYLLLKSGDGQNPVRIHGSLNG